MKTFALTLTVLISLVLLSLNGSAALTFTGGDIGTPGNWVTDDAIPVNELPTSANGYGVTNRGTIAVNGTVTSTGGAYDGLFIEQALGAITQVGIGSDQYTFTNGDYLMSGGTWGTRRGLQVGSGQTFTIDGGVFGVAIPGGGGDGKLIFASGGNFNLDSGSVTVSTDSVFNTGGTLTVSGGTFTSLGTFGNASFHGSGGTSNFDGGTTSLNTVDFGGGTGTLNFGGSTAGTVSAASLAGSFTLDWSDGSLMKLTVAGADLAYYQGLYSSGDLLFEGANSALFGDNFQVSGSTLSLNLIPEPSTFSLLVGLLSMGLIRRRKK